MSEPFKIITAVAPSFPFVQAGDITGGIEPLDFVEGLLTEGGASVIYGPSNCGKSFWILDLAAHVAMGISWRNGEVEVDQGAVVYVALEGKSGIGNRIEAMRRSSLLPDGAPLFVCFSAVSLLERDHAAKLAETVKAAAAQSELPCRLVILDTLARAMPGGNENTGEDMTAAVASVDAVRAATGAHVSLIHHCGKDQAKGARGHSSLRAAVDTEIEVSRGEGEAVSTVKVTKQRDLECRAPMPFSLRTVELGNGRRGKPITSCVVEHQAPEMAAVKRKPGRPLTASDDEIVSLLPQPRTVDWEKAALERLGVTRSPFYKALARLRDSGECREGPEGWELS